MFFGSSWLETPTLRFLKSRMRRLLSNLSLTPPFAARRRNPLSSLGRSIGTEVAAREQAELGRGLLAPSPRGPVSIGLHT